MGPAVTRGVLLEVLGQKLAAGDDAAIVNQRPTASPCSRRTTASRSRTSTAGNTPPAGLGVRRRGR